MIKTSDWEEIKKGEMWRLKIFNGWLVWVRQYNKAGLTFVPDRKHDWKI